jgi:membrane protease YdiL (CAAX protease family)
MAEPNPQSPDASVSAGESMPEAPQPSQLQPPAAPGRRSWAWLAWLVILAVVGFLAFGRTLLKDKEEREYQEDRLSHLVMKLRARYVVGAADILQQKATLFHSAELLRNGDVGSRLRFVVLAGELAGPGEALKELDRLAKDMREHGVTATKEQVSCQKLLRLLYQDYERGRMGAPSFSRAERGFLSKQLNWFGELALAPASDPADAEAPAAAGVPPDAAEREAVLAPARTTFGVTIGAVAAVIFLGIAGFIGAVTLLIFALTGYARGGVQTGTAGGGIYAETFAIWLVLYVGLSLAGKYIELGIPVLLEAGLFMLLSLISLAWPVLRGVPWRQVRQDVGLTFGRNPVIEPAIGVACYAMAIPLVLAGVIVTLVLLWIEQTLTRSDSNPFAPSGLPSHPIIDPLVHGGMEERLLVIFLASVVAPIVEEIMFRGVLYRHLREATARGRAVWSFLISAVVVSFIFAAVHPQGLVGIPVLMALAFGFTVAREWRGTLLPGMVGHALNNGLVTLLVSLMLAD